MYIYREYIHYSHDVSYLRFVPLVPQGGATFWGQLQICMTSSKTTPERKSNNFYQFLKIIVGFFFWRYQNLLRVGFILKSILKQGRKSNSFHYVLGFFFSFFSCFSFVSISGTLNKIDGVSYDIWFYNRITKWQNRISSKYAKVLEANVVFKYIYMYVTLILFFQWSVGKKITNCRLV